MNNVTTYLIDTTFLTSDDCQGYIAAREQELLALIGAAMGKRVQTD